MAPFSPHDRGQEILKKDLIVKIDRNWGKNGIAKYVDKSIRPGTTVQKSDELGVPRPFRNNPRTWRVQLLRSLLDLSYNTQNVNEVKNNLIRIVRFQNRRELYYSDVVHVREALQQRCSIIPYVKKTYGISGRTPTPEPMDEDEPDHSARERTPSEQTQSDTTSATLETKRRNLVSPANIEELTEEHAISPTTGPQIDHTISANSPENYNVEPAETKTEIKVEHVGPTNPPTPDKSGRFVLEKRLKHARAEAEVAKLECQLAEMVETERRYE